MDGGDDTDSQPGTGTGAYVGRTMTSSINELRRMLCWTKDHVPHPLEDLEKLLLVYFLVIYFVVFTITLLYYVLQ